MSELALGVGVDGVMMRIRLESVVATMGVLLVIPEGNVLLGAVVVERCLMLRMTSLRDALASRAMWSWC